MALVSTLAVLAFFDSGAKCRAIQVCAGKKNKEKGRKCDFLLAKSVLPVYTPAVLTRGRKQNGVLAQLVERLNGIEKVSGSNPLCSRLRKTAYQVT